MKIKMLFVLGVVSASFLKMSAVDHCARIRVYTNQNPPIVGLNCYWINTASGGRCIGQCYQDYEETHEECVGTSDAMVCNEATITLNLMRAVGTSCSGSSQGSCGYCSVGTTVTPGPTKRKYKRDVCG